MRYPHLAWAAKQNGLTNYRVAEGVGLSESAFSRGLSGRRDFLAAERERIAVFWGYLVNWLFQEIFPPERSSGNRNNDREFQVSA
jgi:hypothetical protein